MSSGARPPYILEASDPSSGRPATVIFLHGYGDDAQGLPLGLAQQFQFYSKLPYIRWVLPNAPFNAEAMMQAWYLPRALPHTATKPRVPGQAEDDDETEAEDEEGILQIVAAVDKLVQDEIDLRGDGGEPVDAEPAARIIVGGFSQGCAVCLAWSLVGKLRHKVAGVVCLSGYFPLADRIANLRQNDGSRLSSEAEKKKWFYVHGHKDMLVPTRMFRQGKEELAKYVPADAVEGHLYEGMGHSTCSTELRDLLGWLEKVIPP